MVRVTGNGARVLVVDDEPNITELVAMALRYEGFTVKTAATGRGALTAVSQFAPALVILDVMLPDIDGIEVLKRLNNAGTKVPIIFLTAKDATEDKVHGLTIGGDDYVTKPFSTPELLARIRAALRRLPQASDGSLPALNLEGLTIDFEARRVRARNLEVRLTPKEFDLLRYLVANANRAIPHRKLLQTIWGPDYGDEIEYLRVFINHLRKKIEPDPAKPRYILTEPWVGYRFALPTPPQ